MVCYDGSTSADAALKQVLVYFRDKNPEVILITVVEEPQDATCREEEVFNNWRNERQRVLTNAGKSLAAEGVDVSIILGLGDPRKVIEETIKRREPDIVVVAKQGKKISEDYFSNSLSGYLARKVDCRLLVTGSKM